MRRFFAYQTFFKWGMGHSPMFMIALDLCQKKRRKTDAAKRSFALQFMPFSRGMGRSPMFTYRP